MKIVHYPHPALRCQAKPISSIDKKIKLQIGEMFDLMYEAKGSGLLQLKLHFLFSYW
jgi:N-formylmethionyl-tRNA deformylase